MTLKDHTKAWNRLRHPRRTRGLLARLIGIFRPSPNVLTQRLNDLRVRCIELEQERDVLSYHLQAANRALAQDRAVIAALAASSTLRPKAEA